MSSWLRRVLGSFGRSGVTPRAVEPGHRFAKISELMVEAEAAWVVSEIINIPDLPPHARLYQEKAPYRTMTLAMPVLLNRAFYRRLPPANGGGASLGDSARAGAADPYETNAAGRTAAGVSSESNRPTQRSAGAPRPPVGSLTEAASPVDRSPTRPLVVARDGYER